MVENMSILGNFRNMSPGYPPRIRPACLRSARTQSPSLPRRPARIGTISTKLRQGLFPVKSRVRSRTSADWIIRNMAKFGPNFFNVNSPRGAVFSTPGTGFLVSANAGGATPPLFGFPSDFQTFSPQKLFTAVNSNITDVSFFLPGTTTAATTSAFGLIFTDAEVAGLSKLEFFDANNSLIFSRDALVGGNQGLSFLGAVANAGEQISRVRITSGANTIVANGVLGNPNDDIVVMDDFIYATPTAVPEPGTALFGLGLLGTLAVRRRGMRSS
jgi:PEP-CTERM motif